MPSSSPTISDSSSSSPDHITGGYNPSQWSTGYSYSQPDNRISHLDTGVANPHLDTRVSNPHLDTRVSNPHLDIRVSNPHLDTRVTNPHLDIRLNPAPENTRPGHYNNGLSRTQSHQFFPVLSTGGSGGGVGMISLVDLEGGALHAGWQQHQMTNIQVYK